MNNKKMSTKSIVLAGIFVAASIILTRFLGFMILGGTIRISLGSVPIALSGIMLGAVGGTLVGIVADLVGVLLVPQGAFFPGFTLSSALTGLIPALFVHKFYADKNISFGKICILTGISTLVSTLVVSIGLNTLWLSILFKKGFMVLLPERILSSVLIGILSYITTVSLLKILRKAV